uniref:Uncharacterized protein n=1 Tax=Peronospora matthiolae TaxID=2874970 RepID=A0AAV1UGB5_9STRA
MLEVCFVDQVVRSWSEQVLDVKLWDTRSGGKSGDKVVRE